MAAMAKGNYLESEIDTLHKQELIAAGASESYADCMVSMLKTFGYTDDPYDLRNYVNEYQLLEELESKARMADFYCSRGG